MMGRMPPKVATRMNLVVNRYLVTGHWYLVTGHWHLVTDWEPHQLRQIRLSSRKIP